MRGGQKARSTTGARLRRYLRIIHKRTHMHKDMSIQTDMQSHTYTYEQVYTCTYMYRWSWKYLTFFVITVRLHLCSKGTSESQTFLPAGGAVIYLSMWQKRAWLNVWIRVWDTFLYMIQHPKKSLSCPQSQQTGHTENNAWAELSVLEKILCQCSWIHNNLIMSEDVIWSFLDSICIHKIAH